MIRSWGAPASALTALLAAAVSPVGGFFVRGPQSFLPARIYLRQRNAGSSTPTLKPSATTPASTSANAAAPCRAYARLSSPVYSAGIQVRTGNWCMSLATAVPSPAWYCFVLLVRAVGFYYANEEGMILSNSVEVHVLFCPPQAVIALFGRSVIRADATCCTIAY